jgi:nucleotide-binding universal stress UspA family protein
MPIKQILFPLTSYPVATSLVAIAKATSLARSLGAHITAIVNEMEISPAASAIFRLQDVDAIINAEFEKSRKLASDVILAFERVADAAGIAHDHIVVRSMPGDFSPRVSAEARLRDLSVVAIDDRDAQESVAEALVFESGRAVLIFSAASAPELTYPIVNAALAWDASRPAARAIADALPLLDHARNLRIITVVDEKPMDASECSATLSDYLESHGLKATWDKVKSAGRPIGKVFVDYVAEHGIELFVMGAYGHSKLREFVLGGATRSVIASPPAWVLLAH